MSPRGRLIETVDGVPIYAKVRAEDTDPLALAPGRHGRLVPGGQVYEVDRVGPGAAYVHKVYDPPLERKVGPWDKLDDLAKTALMEIESGTPQTAFVAAYHLASTARKCSTIYATRGTIEPGIARGSRFVERLPDAPPHEPEPARPAPLPKAKAPEPATVTTRVVLGPKTKAPAPKAPAPKAPAPKAPASAPASAPAEIVAAIIKARDGGATWKQCDEIAPHSYQIYWKSKKGKG